MAAVETLAFITQELEASGTTIARLRKLLFGPSSEKTRDVLGEQAEDETDDAAAADTMEESASEEPEDAGSEAKIEAEAEAEGRDDGPTGEADQPAQKERKGHGRNGAEAYTGAEKVSVSHDSLEHGDRCPSCQKGKVYRQAKPAVLLRVIGVAPLSATVYELERLRCNLCGEVFTAPAPEGVGDKKYDETAAAMIALLKYGCGLPFNRLGRLGANLGMPLPPATQWEVVAEAAEAFEPVWTELVNQAAGGEVLHIDDTRAKVLALNEEIKKELAQGQSERTGVFTSGVVSTVEGRELAVFFTGRKHAGENLAEVLAQRSPDQSPPIQMCDALSRNTSPGNFETILANCLVHARRHFVDVVHSFPDEVAHVLETLRDVYRNEAATREAELSPEQRLAFHQEQSAPLMQELEEWLQAQFDQRKVEPNSSLGQAIEYMQKHWEPLTLFLRVAGAPLDNNICERGLKKVILHRKNSLFYKTENGAHVGDVFMSLIHTAELCGVNPFDYLVAVQRHRDVAERQPDQWMPWSYVQTLAGLDDHAEPPKSPPDISSA